MAELDVEPTKAEEERFKQSIKALMNKMEHIKVAFGLFFMSIMVLNFLGKVPFYSFFIFFGLLLIVMVVVLYGAVKCPRCQTSPFSKAGFESQPFCAQCGLKLNDIETTAERVAQKYPDEKASEISWDQVGGQSSNMDSYRLVETKEGTFFFKPTAGGLFFSGLFVALGLIFFYLMWRDLPKNVEIFSKDVLILFIPLLFTFVGSTFLFPLLRPKEFSLTDGVYKNGNKADIILLKVQALQLLSYEVFDSDGADYTNYELNFVFHDKSRENIVSYANKGNAIADSQKLADYLGVKLWNGV